MSPLICPCNIQLKVDEDVNAKVVFYCKTQDLDKQTSIARV